jgi:hypothetical protein
MSERNLWKWINSKMKEVPSWRSCRLENCSEKGIPDSVVSIKLKTGEKVAAFMELKDWSGPKKHPLLVEQKNFLSDFGGIVLVKANDCIAACYGHDLTPLLSCDVNWALNTCNAIAIKDFSVEWMMAQIIHCKW